MKTYHEKVFEEISKAIVDNLEILYNFEDESLINIKNHCRKNNHHRYKPLTYNELVYFLEEAISEIINMPFLYDFRDLKE